MREVYADIINPQDGFPDLDTVRKLRDVFRDEGPLPLAPIFDSLVENFSVNTILAIKEPLRIEIFRIQRAMIASFVHPNHEGAKRYADTAMKRYRAHKDVMAKLPLDVKIGDSRVANPPGETLDAMLRRYGVRGQGPLRADIGHLGVDAFFVRVVTATTSGRDHPHDVFLEVETESSGGSRKTHSYRLNFPYDFDIGGGCTSCTRISSRDRPTASALRSADASPRHDQEGQASGWWRSGGRFPSAARGQERADSENDASRLAPAAGPD
jgi:hypothetical protein